MNTRSARGPSSTPVAACSVCGQLEASLDSGLCATCRERPEESSALLGGCCAVCGLSDGRMLRPARVGHEIHCLCRNHAWLAEKARPRPESLDVLRAWLVPTGNRRRSLERRQGERRRAIRRSDRPDRRLAIRVPDKADRRGADRRSVTFL